MHSLESLERKTPEFDSLTEGEKNKRRRLLSGMLGNILKDPSSFGLETAIFTGELLEFHLTEKVERFREESMEKIRKSKK